MSTPHDENPGSPPKGDHQKAEKYISKLIQLLNQDKVEVIHTDLNRFDPGSIQDHYRVDLKEYQIEISHSKLPSSGADSFVMIFTNFSNVQAGNTEKVILAYTQLSEAQFTRFKTAAEDQLERERKVEEEKRFNSATAPIDQILESAFDPNDQQPQPEEQKEESTPSQHYQTNAQSQTPDQPAQTSENKQDQDESLSDRANTFYRAVS